VNIGLAQWLSSFSAALATADAQTAGALFDDRGMWRDLVAFGWNIATYEGRDLIKTFVRDLGPLPVTNISLEAAPDAVEGFARFNVPNGEVRAHLRLHGGKCQTLLTSLETLAGHPEAIDSRRWSGLINSAAQCNWADRRAAEQRALGTEMQPYVLIVGAGQSGLAVGARLKALGVPTLLIDKYPRVGDQWRSRYKSLTLHDPVWYDHLPYMPFPRNWPVYTPKDKMGDWLEIYARAMELVIWTHTELLSANYDEQQGAWSVRVSREGKEMDLRPQHCVLALGNAGFPRIPSIPGAERFRGPQYHSSVHSGGEQLAGKKVVIVGANNSAHDIAADLITHGSRPTLIQRSSTLIVRQQTLTEFVLKDLYSQQAFDSGVDTDTADLIALSLPLRLAENHYKPIWQNIATADADFYAALRKAGFTLDFAEDGAGLTLKFCRTFAGYYIDVGASQMVIDGRIAVRSGVDIEEIDEDSLILSDGSRVDADAIIYATGFGSMDQWVGSLFGEEVARRVGRCWGYGSGFKGDPGPWEGEIRNMWKPTAQDGLWFMAGNLAQARSMSRYLAIQLKARYEGMPVKVLKPHPVLPLSD
jgi:putative flavoprotein involved in K+ transport